MEDHVVMLVEPDVRHAAVAYTHYYLCLVAREHIEARVALLFALFTDVIDRLVCQRIGLLVLLARNVRDVEVIELCVSCVLENLDRSVPFPVPKDPTAIFVSPAMWPR